MLQRLSRPPSDERQPSKRSVKQSPAETEREAHWQVLALRASFVKSRRSCAAYEVGGRAGEEGRVLLQKAGTDVVVLACSLF